MNFSMANFCRHISIVVMNSRSASSGSIVKAGRELRPNPIGRKSILLFRKKDKGHIVETPLGKPALYISIVNCKGP